MIEMFNKRSSPTPLDGQQDKRITEHYEESSQYLDEEAFDTFS
ncbi:hypothetical protein [Priestia megaterium]